MRPKSTEPSFSEDKPITLSTKNIALPLWLVASMLSGCVAFTIYAMTLLNTINGKLDAAGVDRWRLSYQREWKYQLERNNKSLVIPDPDDIVKKFNP